VKPLEFQEQNEGISEIKFKELDTNSKNKNMRDIYRGINQFKKGCQLRTNLVKDENGDLLGDSQNILKIWKNYLCQLYTWC
jgi:hypothetical protein